jgi:hypothetical protein
MPSSSATTKSLLIGVILLLRGVRFLTFFSLLKASLRLVNN